MTQTTLPVGDHEYLLEPMPAKRAWNLVRRLLPLIASSGQLLTDMVKQAQSTLADASILSVDWQTALGPIAIALSKMTDEDSDYVIDACLGQCRRRAGKHWLPVAQFQDLTMEDQFTLVGAVLRENIGNFFSALRALSPEPPAATADPST